MKINYIHVLIIQFQLNNKIIIISRNIEKLYQM